LSYIFNAVSVVVLSTRGYQFQIANLFKQKNPLALYFQRVLLYNKKRPDSYQDVYQKIISIVGTW